MRSLQLVAAALAILMMGATQIAVEGAPAPGDAIRVSLKVGERFSLGQGPGKQVTVGAPAILAHEPKSDLGLEDFTCLREGVSVVTIEYADGSQVSWLVECKAGFGEFAPPPGGGADDARRYSTGEGTRVTKVTCRSPLSCEIANRGMDGGFLARCIGQGSADGDYEYQLIYDAVQNRLIMVAGKLRARCPRD